MQNQIQGMIIEPFDYPALDDKAIRQITSIIEFNDPPVPHGLIMSKKALTPAEQATWRGVMDDMRKDGTITNIFKEIFQT